MAEAYFIIITLLICGVMVGDANLEIVDARRVAIP